MYNEIKGNWFKQSLLNKKSGLLMRQVANIIS